MAGEGEDGSDYYDEEDDYYDDEDDDGIEESFELLTGTSADIIQRLANVSGEGDDESPQRTMMLYR